MTAIIAAGSNLVAITAAFAAPALLHSDQIYVIEAAGMIVGLQAGSSAVIQVASPIFKTLGNGRIIILAALFASAAIQLMPIGPLLGLLCATFGGAMSGLLLGERALRVLQSQGGARFQVHQALRSVTLLLIILLGILLGRWLPGTEGFTASLSLSLFAVAHLRASATSPSAKRAILPVISTVFGLLAALYYRNDINWVRSAEAGSADFVAVHYALVIYTAAQACVGFMVIQFIFSKRDMWRRRVSTLSGGTYALAIFGWALLCALVALVVGASSPFVGILTLTIIAGLVGFASAFAHVCGANWVPYTAGVVGASALLASLSLGAPSNFALLAENIVIGSIIVFGLLLRRKRLSSS